MGGGGRGGGVGGACLRHVVNLIRQSKRWGAFKIYGEPESPKLKDGACVRYMVIRNRTMRGVFRICDES